MPDEELKQCSCCEEWKAKGEFRPRKGQCNDCVKKKGRARMRRNYQKDPELHRARQREWLQKEGNKERKAERHRLHRLQNLDKMRHQEREYNRLNPEKRRNYRRQNLENQQKYHFERARFLWGDSIAAAGGVCQKCSQVKQWQIMSFHHVNPKEKTKPSSKAVLVQDMTELDKCALLCIECHFLFEARVWQGVWRKRDGLGWELVEWWHTFRYSGENIEVSDIRFMGVK